MMLFPIVERELRVAVRKPITYWSRVSAALAAAALVVWMLVTLGTLVSPDLLGARMFKTLATVAFFCCLLPGVVLTADCISEERREGTLGLLFLTDLKGYDVVLGKLLATSLRAFYGLIAVLPLLAVSFFVGGVTFGEFWRVLAALLNTLWLSLAAGMFLSSISWRDQRSMLGTALLILGVTYILPACLTPLAALSPQTMFSSAFEAQFVKAWIPFTLSIAFVHLNGWLFLGIAAWVVGRRIAIEPAGREDSIQAARVPSPLMESHPAEWLACRSARHGWLWMSLSIPVAVWGAGVAVDQKWWNPLALLAVVFALHLLVQFWLAWESTRRFNEIRRNGNLELLMSTPVSDRDIVQGQAIGLERQFAGPVFAVLTMDALLIILSRTHFKWPEGEAFEFFTMTAAMIFGSLVNSYAMAWVGLWHGLKTRRAGAAGLQTLARIVLIPSAVFMLPLAVLIVSAGGSGTGLLSGSGVIWATVMTINSVWFCTIARKKLEREFRIRAAGIEPEPAGSPLSAPTVPPARLAPKPA